MTDTSAQRHLVLSHIKATGMVTRQDIADQMGLPIQSVCGRVDDLLQAGLLTEEGGKIGRMGRFQKFVRVRTWKDQVQVQAAQADLFGTNEKPAMAGGVLDAVSSCV